MGEHRVVEHTADVGIYAAGATLEELFTQATLGLLDIAGAFRSGAGAEEVSIEVSAHDLGAVLVDWLSEVLYLQDARDSLVNSVGVEAVTADSARGRVSISPRGEESIEGTPVKAITYHQLQVEETEEGWWAHVFFDI